MPRLRRMHSKPVATGSLPGTYVEDASPLPETDPEPYRRFLRMIPEVRDLFFEEMAKQHDTGDEATEEALTRMIDAAEKRYESENKTVRPEP